MTKPNTAPWSSIRITLNEECEKQEKPDHDNLSRCPGLDEHVQEDEGAAFMKGAVKRAMANEDHLGEAPSWSQLLINNHLSNRNPSTQSVISRPTFAIKSHPGFESKRSIDTDLLPRSLKKNVQ